jgi:hypothetical protein
MSSTWIAPPWVSKSALFLQHCSNQQAIFIVMRHSRRGTCLQGMSLMLHDPGLFGSCPLVGRKRQSAAHCSLLQSRGISCRLHILTMLPLLLLLLLLLAV